MPSVSWGREWGEEHTHGILQGEWSDETFDFKTYPLRNDISQASDKKLQNYFSIHLIDFSLILVDDIELRSFRHSLQYSDPYITPKRKSQTQS